MSFPRVSRMTSLDKSSDSGAPCPKLLFVDTEFTDLHADARLISIGLVSDDDQRRFYAELSDTYRLSDCSDFVKETVLPLLQGGDALMTRAELRAQLHAWLSDFRVDVQIATDSPDWDWRWLQFIFPASTWPENVITRPFLLQFEGDTGELFNGAVESAWARLRHHHALDDALANRFGWLAVGTV